MRPASLSELEPDSIRERFGATRRGMSTTTDKPEEKSSEATEKSDFAREMECLKAVSGSSTESEARRDGAFRDYISLRRVDNALYFAQLLADEHVLDPTPPTLLKIAEMVLREKREEQKEEEREKDRQAGRYSRSSHDEDYD